MTTQVFEGSDDRTYTVVKQLPDGETYDRWEAIDDQHPKRRSVLVRAAGNVSLNEYADNEVRVLRHLNGRLADAHRPIRLLVPELLDAFESFGRRVLITDYDPTYFTLEEIRSAYPQGVPAPHVAWMFNRMLAAIMAAHSAGVIHGAVLPCNMLLHSGNKQDEMRHTGILTEWTCALIERERNKNEWGALKAWDDRYAEFYPEEVTRRQPVTPATDLAMAAGCAIYLLGGNVASGEVPSETPWNMAQLLRVCRDRNPDRRPRDLAAFHKQFQAMLRTVFGEPVFRELPLPPRS